MQQLITVDNVWLGVQTGRQIQVFWVYNNFINDCYQQLSPIVQEQIFNNDPSSYSNFPNYSTLNTELTPTQINLLAAQTSWSVAEARAKQILSMYQSTN